jgi:hypothetical protein
MLPRHCTLAIIVGWLVTGAWFLQYDLRPRVSAEEPAPFAISLVDEARMSLIGRPRPRQRAVDVPWKVVRNDHEWNAAKAFTRVQSSEWDGTLEFGSELRLPSKNDLRTSRFEVASTCRITWEGELQELDAEARSRKDMRANAPEPPPERRDAPLDPRVRRFGGQPADNTDVAARLEAKVRNGRFLPHWRVNWDQTEEPPVPLSRRGHVLLPFHPMNRLPGLRLGQSWPMPLIDLEAATNLAVAGAIRTVQADVSEGILIWQGRSVPCFVVTYRQGGGVRGRTWVRQSDALVLKQEATFDGDRLALERMPEK